ncbi:hypothetical protein Trydic_g17418 [Trypoxylus dichotomus]
MQNVHYGVRCVARSAVLLEPHVVRVHTVQSTGYYHSVPLNCDGDDLTNVVFGKVWTNDTINPKPATNTNILWMFCYLVNLVWVVVVPYTEIMSVSIAIHPKTCLVARDDFSAKIRVLLQTLRSAGREQTALSVVINFELPGRWILKGCRPKFKIEICLPSVFLHTLADSHDVLG